MAPTTPASIQAVEFEPWSDADIDAVLAIETSVAAFPWTRGHFTDSWKAGYSGWVGRDADRGVLGYYLLMLAVDEIHLLNLGVARAAQGRGLGARLLAHALGNAWRVGGRSMFLEVRPSNAAAISLYERFGFAEVGRRRGYYPAASGREDAIVMRRALSARDFEGFR